MIISQDITDNSQRFGVKHICRSHQPTLRPKPAKELAYLTLRQKDNAAKMKNTA